MLSTADSVIFELEDVSGDDAQVEVQFRRDTVELRCDEHLKAVFDRDELRAWLDEPSGVLSVDDVALALHDEHIHIWIDPLVPWRRVLVMVEVTEWMAR